MAAPGKTKEHQHHQKSFNGTTHILAKSKLVSLGDEMVAATYSCGEALIAIILYSLDMREITEVWHRLIIFKGFLMELDGLIICTVTIGLAPLLQRTRISN